MQRIATSERKRKGTGVNGKRKWNQTGNIFAVHHFHNENTLCAYTHAQHTLTHPPDLLSGEGACVPSSVVARAGPTAVVTVTNSDLFLQYHILNSHTYYHYSHHLCITYNDNPAAFVPHYTYTHYSTYYTCHNNTVQS